MATLETIEARYNPEHDMIKDGPNVTWAEMVLVDHIKKLEERIVQLEDALENTDFTNRNSNYKIYPIPETAEHIVWSSQYLMSAWCILQTIEHPNSEELDKVIELLRKANEEIKLWRSI